MGWDSVTKVGTPNIRGGRDSVKQQELTFNAIDVKVNCDTSEERP
jgi:hypothetical protein